MAGSGSPARCPLPPLAGGRGEEGAAGWRGRASVSAARGPERWGGPRGGWQVRGRAARERAAASPPPPQGRWVARGSQRPGPRGGGGEARAAAAGGGLGAPAMSQAERKGGAALEVKFVPDEAVLRHIADDAGTAGPAPRRAAGGGAGRASGLGRLLGSTGPATASAFSSLCLFRRLRPRLEGSPGAATAPCSSLPSPPSFSAP